MLSNYISEQQSVKQEIKDICEALINSHTIINTSVKENNINRFNEAKKYINNIANRLNNIDNYIIKILALYSPEARELRRFVAYLKITNELLRINSNTKSFLKGYSKTVDIFKENNLSQYLVPLHTSSLQGLELVYEMFDIDEEDELQDKFNEVIVQENKTDDFYDILQENVFTLTIEFKSINQLLKTSNKIAKIADRNIEIANLLLYYKIGGRLENI